MECPNCENELNFRLIEEVILLGKENKDYQKYINFIGFYKNNNERNDNKILICCLNCTYAIRKGLNSVNEGVK